MTAVLFCVPFLQGGTSRLKLVLSRCWFCKVFVRYCKSSVGFSLRRFFLSSVFFGFSFRRFFFFAFHITDTSTLFYLLPSMNQQPNILPEMLQEQLRSYFTLLQQSQQQQQPGGNSLPPPQALLSSIMAAMQNNPQMHNCSYVSSPVARSSSLSLLPNASAVERFQSPSLSRRPSLTQSPSLSRSSSLTQSPSLSRSSSNASTSSTMAAPGTPRTSSDYDGMPELVDESDDGSSSSSDSDSDSENENDENKRNKRRKKRRRGSKKGRKKRRRRRVRGSSQLTVDKKAVNSDLMALLDQQYLAPQMSALFVRNYRKSPPGTPQVLKKTEDFNLVLFKQLTRLLLRSLVSRDLPHLQQQHGEKLGLPLERDRLSGVELHRHFLKLQLV